MLAHEYGWSAEYIMDLPIDITPRHIHAILHRNGAKCFRRVVDREPSAPSLQARISEILASIDTTSNA